MCVIDCVEKCRDCVWGECEMIIFVHGGQAIPVKQIPYTYIAYAARMIRSYRISMQMDGIFYGSSGLFNKSINLVSQEHTMQHSTAYILKPNYLHRTRNSVRVTNRWQKLSQLRITYLHPMGYEHTIIHEGPMTNIRRDPHWFIDDRGALRKQWPRHGCPLMYWHGPNLMSFGVGVWSGVLEYCAYESALIRDAALQSHLVASQWLRTAAGMRSAWWVQRLNPSPSPSNHQTRPKHGQLPISNLNTPSKPRMSIIPRMTILWALSIRRQILMLNMFPNRDNYWCKVRHLNRMPKLDGRN